MYNLYNKKSNIKSFFKKVKEYNLLKDFFEMNNINNFPFISNMEHDQSCDIVYDFYLGLEDDIRKDLKIELEKIIFISNYQAIKIADSISNTISSNNTTHNIIANNYEEKAIAFYLDNFQEISKVINIYSFYKVSGWKRFEALGFNNKTKTDLNQTINDWKEKYIQKYFDDNKVYPSIIDSDIYFYDNKYFAFMDINTDNITSSNASNSKRIFIVVLPDISEALIKMSGSFVDVFYMLDIFLKKFANLSIDMKEEKYNFDKLLENFYEESQNIFNNQNINNWRVKSVNIKNNQNILNLKFNKTSDSENFYDMISFAKNYNLDFTRFEIDSISFDIEVIINAIDIIKKKVSLNLKKNKSNLNLLKNEHLLLHKILKEKNIFEGFVDIKL